MRLWIVLLVFLAGCSSLNRLPDEDGKPETAIEKVRDVLASPENTALCQSADVATTMLALGKGGVEKNPLMAKVIKAFGYGGLIGFKLAIVYYAFQHFDQTSERERIVLAIANGATCAIAAHNVKVGRSLVP